MNWQIEMVSSRHGKAFEWTVTKGVNLRGDGPEATVCKVTSSAEDAALIAAAPEMVKHIETDIKILEQLKSCFVIGSTQFVSICLRIETKQKLLAKARGEK